MKFGRFEIDTIEFGTFRLDGGAMFGSVPKNLWSKKIPADADNCIPMATRCLYVRVDGRKILVDVGNGDKWDEKARAIFSFKNADPASLPFKPDDITDIILTHLHFDHAGGISKWKGSSRSEVELCYPKARVFLQKANLENARNPSLRERASYLRENVDVLSSADLTLTEGSVEILPGLWVHRIDGHTVGQQWIEFKEGGSSVLYPTDLVPTSHHVPLAYTMGYDICASTTMNEKEKFLKYAIERNATIVFEHDPLVGASAVTVDARGQFTASSPRSSL